MRITYLLSLVARHSYLALGLVVGLGALGIPMPVTVTLIAAGAASAAKVLRPEIAFVVSVAASMLGDNLLYWLGRHTGWWLLGTLCRVSLNPEACILRSAEAFYRRGRLAVVLAKFVPGIGALAAPLAGSMKMGPGQFARLDLAAACLYTAVYGSLGYLLGNLIAASRGGVQAAGLLIKLLIGFGLAGYIGRRVYLYWKQRKQRAVPYIDVRELAGRIAAADPVQPLIVDVRSHGYYDPGARRIKGSNRIEPNQLLAAIKDLPRNRELYLYCT